MCRMSDYIFECWYGWSSTELIPISGLLSFISVIIEISDFCCSYVDDQLRVFQCV